MERLTDADYDAMAVDYAANPPRPEELLDIEVNPAYLTVGRPTSRSGRTGKSPTLSIRLPEELRRAADLRAQSENVTTGELVRRAVSEYLARQ